MIRAITFDLDNTLFDLQSCMTRAGEQVLRSLCEREPTAAGHATLERFEALWRRATEEARRGGSVPDWPSVRRRGIDHLLQECGCGAGETLAEELTALYFRTRQLPPDPFDDAAAALPCLAGRVPLGIITNGTRHPAQFGLAAHFQAVVTPEITTCMKPAPEIFRHAASLLGCAPAELLHVGDSWEDDVVGALGAGCQAAWYCRVPKPVPEGVVPHLVLGDHRELIAWLRERSRKSSRVDLSPGPTGFTGVARK
jgi:HAD superfamily hydrolase (TIGR01509 family)